MIEQKYTTYIELYFPDKNYDRYELKYNSRGRVSGSEYEDIVTYSSIIDASNFTTSTVLESYDFYVDPSVTDSRIRELSLELGKAMVGKAITILINTYSQFNFRNLGWIY